MELIQEDVLSNGILLQQASRGKRVANYLIDMAIFYILCICVGIIIAILNPGVIDSMDDSSGTNLLERLVGLILYGIYMGLVEGVFKGRSLGKVITGTRVVNEDGTAITFGTAFKRGLCRIVPFHPFSALGTPCYPWHDEWTHTYVIDVKQSVIS